LVYLGMGSVQRGQPRSPDNGLTYHDFGIDRNSLEQFMVFHLVAPPMSIIQASFVGRNNQSKSRVTLQSRVARSYEWRCEVKAKQNDCQIWAMMQRQ